MIERALLTIMNDRAAFLAFLKKKFLLFHRSNVFFRDLQYGIQEYLGQHGMSLNYRNAERVATAVVGALEQAGLLVRVDEHTWWLQYEPFRLAPAVKPAASSAPAA